MEHVGHLQLLFHNLPNLILGLFGLVAFQSDVGPMVFGAHLIHLYLKTEIHTFDDSEASKAPLNELSASCSKSKMILRYNSDNCIYIICFECNYFMFLFMLYELIICLVAFLCN